MPFFVFFVTIFLGWGPVLAGERLLNTIAIIVNDDFITLYEVKREIAPNAPDGVSDREIAAHRTDAADRLIADRLVKQEIKRRSITVGDTELDRAIENVAEQNGITVDKLKEEITAQGVSWETYRNEVLRKQLEVLSLKRDIAMATLDVDETTLRDLYKRHFSGGVLYTASHILLRVDSPQGDAEVYERISDIYRAITAGELSFEEAAKRWSEDPSSAQGGHLPSFRFGEMDPKFSEKVAELAAGQISRPFRTKFGWHIARLEKAERNDPPPFEEVRDKLRFMFYQMNQNKAFENWLKARRATSIIKILF